MLKTTHAHSFVLLALLAPVLACGDGGGGDSSVEETKCYEREDLWRRVLQDESSTTSAASTSASASSGGGAGTGIPDGCPDRDRARPIVEFDSGVNPDDDDSLRIEQPKQDGESCCYATSLSQGVTGRPVRVDDEIVVASLRRDAARSSDTDVPRAVVAYWEHVARLEHASVASFALLSLDLIAHGAPMDLVADSQRASLDEVRHAEAMFAHASRLGCARVGPGDMATLAACRLSPDVGALVAATVRDGCVNETFASFEAAEQAALCDDAQIARDLAAIAVDEAGHAALAWRIVAWALRAGKTTPDHVARCLRSSIAELRAGGAGHAPSSLERHGILSAATRDELASEVSRHVEAIGARLLATSELAHAA
jgi:hypothetical protein